MRIVLFQKECRNYQAVTYQTYFSVLKWIIFTRNVSKIRLVTVSNRYGQSDERI